MHNVTTRRARFCELEIFVRLGRFAETLLVDGWRRIRVDEVRDRIAVLTSGSTSKIFDRVGKCLSVELPARKIRISGSADGVQDMQSRSD